jgi:hypothetical protein
MRTGDTLAADLIVLATGYKGQEHLVSTLFGGYVAERVGPIWGFGDEQELRNMFVRTAQPGLWFIAGSLAQCRIYPSTWGCRSRPAVGCARARGANSLTKARRQLMTRAASLKASVGPWWCR